MKLIKQLFWIFLFAAFGELVSLLLAPLAPLPGPVIGMVLLFFALHLKLIRLEQVDEAGTWLTNNMAIFFVPLGVGLILHVHVFAQTWWQLLIVIMLTVPILLGIVGQLVQQVMRWQQARGK